MSDEVLFHRGTTLVRRLRLAPGDAMPSPSNIAMGVRASGSKLLRGKSIGTSRPSAFTAVSMSVNSSTRKSQSSFSTIPTLYHSPMKNSQCLLAHCPAPAAARLPKG